MLAQDKTELHFEEAIHWDIDVLCKDFAAWMTADNDQPATISRVGVLSSMQCQRLFCRYSNDDMCTYLPLLVLSSSLLYNRQGPPHPRYTYECLSSARSVLGNELLKHLETALKPASLSKMSKQQLEVIFMVVFGTIIAVVYSCKTGPEEARVELVRILNHYLILVGERVGLLQCEMKKIQLTEGCHNLWNKTGKFEWDYDTESTPNNVAFGAQDESYLGRTGDTSSLTGAYESPLPHDHHDMFDPFLDLSTTDELLTQTGSSINAIPSNNGHFGPPHDFARCRYSSETGICRPNRYHASDDLSLFRFGQPPKVAAFDEMLSQNSFDPAQQILQPHTLCPEITKTEFSPTYGTKNKSSNGLDSSDLPRSDSDPRRSQTSRYSLRARTNSVSDDPIDAGNKSRLGTPMKGKKRKRKARSKNMAKNTTRKIQKTATEQKAQPSKRTTENLQRTSKPSPLDIGKLKPTSQQYSSFNYYCFQCGMGPMLGEAHCPHCLCALVDSSQSRWTQPRYSRNCSSRSLV